MKIIKFMSLGLITLSASAALTSFADLSLLSAADFTSSEQIAYESLEEPQKYDPDKFALEANRHDVFSFVITFSYF